MNENRGLLIVVSGPSGAGKGTVLHEVLAKSPNLKYSVSVTTRAPRPGEMEGVNYFYKTKEQYMEMLADDAFLETQQVYDNFYGTPRDYVKKLRDDGIDVLLEIDVKGALQVKKNVSDATLIFLAPPSVEILIDRLKGRATESEEQLRLRIDSAINELQKMDKYEYVVVNDDKDRCVEDIMSIIRAEHREVVHNTEFIKNLLK